MTEGIDDSSLDEIGSNWFWETHRLLRKEAWYPNPVRRTYIPKPNGKMRPLGISSPRDKIVQQAMKLTLDTILEPKFSDLSHGFRPGRGCHSALREVREWKGVVWFVEGDIDNFFPDIDHHILEGLLKEHFNEARFINLFWKFARAGYVEWDENKVTFVNSDLGVPQGSIISPVLSNLVLHRLDKFMEAKIEEWERNNKNLKPHVTNPEYHKLTMRISRLKTKIKKLNKLNLTHSSESKDLEKTIIDRRRLKSLLPNPDYKKIRYVRYADDWLVGLWGKKEDAVQLKSEIASLLKELKHKLSVEKTLITNARENRAKFLGTYIKRMASGTSTFFDKKGKTTKRIAAGNLWMSAPILELVKNLEDKKFLKGRKSSKSRWSAKHVWRFTLIPVQDIIMRYNSIVNGILNYYSFADNRLRLNKIVWILRESLRKTICVKLKLNKKNFLRKFGKNITVKTFLKKKDGIKLTSFISPDLTRRPMNFLGGAIFRDPMMALYKKISTINSLGMVCSNCGSSSRVEMHHVRHVKTVNIKLSPFDKMMARINRKQVPLCRPCHQNVHRGTYAGMSLKNYNKVLKVVTR